MLPKKIRDLRREARTRLNAMKRVLKLMDGFLSSDVENKILLASAFFQVLMHHMEEGDLNQEGLTLATYLRGVSYPEQGDVLNDGR